VAESKARFTSSRETWVREEDGTALFERDAFAFLAARRLASLEGEHEGLVFGRLDFLEPEIRYIGRLGVRTDDYEPLVIDWRAGAAEPFYRATPVQPMDVIRRRVLNCRDDKVIGVEDDVLMPTHLPDDMTVIGDGALMRALKRARGSKMRDIVATIQAEQDEAIRAPYQGFTLITGGPGTGKTVVGLHRIAFLLYTHRRRFANGGVLVIGPSGVFMDYIERVLPSLGEESVTLKSLGQVASDRLGITATTRESPEAWAIKGAWSMVDLLGRLVEYSPGAPGPLTLTIKGEPFTLTAERLVAIRQDCLSRQPYNDARSLAESQIIARMWVSAEPRLRSVNQKLFDDLVRSAWAFTTFMDRWWPMIDATEMLARLRDPRLVEQLSDLNPEQAKILAESIDPEHWQVADIPLLDELAERLGRVPIEIDEDDSLLMGSGTEELVTISERLTDHREREAGTPHDTFAHILVDEAQDITPMQWRMIHRRGPNASWTIVADPAQSSWPDRDEPTRFLISLIGNREQRSFRLSTNYRSPKEAYKLATRYLRNFEPDIDVPKAVRYTGFPPRLLVAPRAQLAAQVAEATTGLLEELEGTIGIITPDYSAEIEAALPQNPRIMVLDPLSSKGLEFDGVVVVDPDSIAAASASGPRTLYVALTRPTQILVTIDIDTPGVWRPGS
jgi:DNA helicase IV